MFSTHMYWILIYQLNDLINSWINNSLVYLGS